MTEILVIDDHEVVRAGLKALLEALMPHSRISEAWDAESAFAKIKEREYSMVILDINIPGTNSIELVIDILAMRPQMPILMFSMNAEEVYAKKYLQLGVKGYVSKNAPGSEILHAVKAVLEHNKYLSPALKNSLIDEVLGNRSANPFKDLSPRELQICQYLIKGRSSAEIISHLNLTSSTVGTFKARIFRKLNCRNVIELSKLAKLHNIIPD
jgi:two-component system invasion response regulator UvrY